MIFAQTSWKEYLPAFRWGEAAQEIETPATNFLKLDTVLFTGLSKLFSWVSGFLWQITLWMADVALSQDIQASSGNQINRIVSVVGQQIVIASLFPAIVVGGVFFAFIQYLRKPEKRSNLGKAIFGSLCAAAFLLLYVQGSTAGHNRYLDEENFAKTEQQACFTRNKNAYEAAITNPDTIAAAMRLYGSLPGQPPIRWQMEQFMALANWQPPEECSLARFLNSPTPVISGKGILALALDITDTVGASLSEIATLDDGGVRTLAAINTQGSAGNETSPLDCQYYVEELHRRAKIVADEESSATRSGGAYALAKAISDVWMATTYPPQSYAQFGESAIAPAVYCRTLEALSEIHSSKQHSITLDAAAGSGEHCDMTYETQNNPPEWQIPGNVKVPGNVPGNGRFDRCTAVAPFLGNKTLQILGNHQTYRTIPPQPTATAGGSAGVVQSIKSKHGRGEWQGIWSNVILEELEDVPVSCDTRASTSGETACRRAQAFMSIVRLFTPGNSTKVWRIPRYPGENLADGENLGYTDDDDIVNAFQPALSYICTGQLYEDDDGDLKKHERNEEKVPAGEAENSVYEECIELILNVMIAYPLELKTGKHEYNGISWQYVRDDTLQKRSGFCDDYKPSADDTGFSIAYGNHIRTGLNAYFANKVGSSNGGNHNCDEVEVIPVLFFAGVASGYIDIELLQHSDVEPDYDPDEDPELFKTSFRDDNNVLLMSLEKTAAKSLGLMGGWEGIIDRTHDVIDGSHRNLLPQAGAATLRLAISDGAIEDLDPNFRLTQEDFVSQGNNIDEYPAKMRMELHLKEEFATPFVFQQYRKGINYHHGVRLANFWAICQPNSAATPVSNWPAGGYDPAAPSPDITIGEWKVREAFADVQPLEVSRFDRAGALQSPSAKMSDLFENDGRYHTCAAVWANTAARADSLGTRTSPCGWQISVAGFDINLDSVCTGLTALLNRIGAGDRKIVTGDITNVHPSGSGMFELTADQIYQAENLDEDARAWISQANRRSGPGLKAMTAAGLGVLVGFALFVLIGGLLFLVLGAKMVVILGLSLLPVALVLAIWPSERTQKPIGRLGLGLLLAAGAQIFALLALSLLTLALWITTVVGTAVLGDLGYGIMSLLLTLMSAVLIFLAGRRIFRSAKSVYSGMVSSSERGISGIMGAPGAARDALRQTPFIGSARRNKLGQRGPSARTIRRRDTRTQQGHGTKPALNKGAAAKQPAAQQKGGPPKKAPSASGKAAKKSGKAATKIAKKI